MVCMLYCQQALLAAGKLTGVFSHLVCLSLVTLHKKKLAQ